MNWEHYYPCMFQSVALFFMTLKLTLKSKCTRPALFDVSICLQFFVPLQTIIHEKWTGNVGEGHDIALLKLSGQSKHTPVRLPPCNHKLPGGSELMALGWGFQDESGGTTKDLQQATTIDLIPSHICKAEEVWGSIIKDSMICAFSFKGEDVCKGNSVYLPCFVILFTIIDCIVSRL